MHEVSVIEEIVNTVLKESSKYPDSKVDSVSLQIGKLRQFVPEIMQFCYEVAVRETPLAGSELRLTEIPIRIFCPNCNKATDLEEYDFHCPNCQSVDIQVVSGNELILDSIELNTYQTTSFESSK